MARRYTPSQKAKAIELAATIGPAKAAKQLGISRFSIYEWRRKLRLAAEGKADCPTSGPDPIDVETQRDIEILEMWKLHPGLGPSQISNQLRRKGIKANVNTVRRVMEDAGYRPPKVKRTAHTQRYEAVRPNHMSHGIRFHGHTGFPNSLLTFIRPWPAATGRFWGTRYGSTKGLTDPEPVGAAHVRLRG